MSIVRINLLFACLVVFMSSTCSPINIKTIIKTNDDVKIANNSLVVDSVGINFNIVHSHAISKHTGLLFEMEIVNNSSSVTTVKPSCINLKSNKLTYQTDSVYTSYNINPFLSFNTNNTTRSIDIQPTDTLIYRAIYASSFKGTLGSYRDTLKKIDVYFDLNNVFIKGDELKLLDIQVIPDI